MSVDRSLWSLAVCAWALSSLTGCPGGPHEHDSTAAGFPSSDDSGGTEGNGDPPGDGAEFFLEHRSYFIGEAETYDGPGLCSSGDLNAVTATLRDRLDDAGWSGLRFVDANSWPEDFREASKDPTWLDESYGDAARLSIFAGHGEPGELQWGIPSAANQCTTDIADQSHFGRLAGDRAAAVMLLSSCTLHTDLLKSKLDEHATRQFFGFHDSPYIGYDEPRKVFKRTQDGQSSGNAWLDEMENNGAIGSNSPVVATYAKTYADAQALFDEAKLASGEGYTKNVEDPPAHLYYEWVDNGCSCFCRVDAALPGLAPGEGAPVLELRRPLRAPEQLAQRVGALAALLGHDTIGSLDSAAAAWADELPSIKDLSFTLASADPRIEVSYDPATDALTVVNRAALLRARPRGPDDLSAPVDEQGARAEAELLRLALEARGLLSVDSSEAPAPLELEATREAGFGARGEAAGPTIPFEYLFGSPRRVGGLRIAGAHLQIGVTRDGELSRLRISELEVETVGGVPLERSPESTLAAFLAELELEHPAALEVAVTYADVGYALAEDQSVAVLRPSLLLEYSLRFPGGVSRRVPVALSLTTGELEVRELAARGPEDGGDARPQP